MHALLPVVAGALLVGCWFDPEPSMNPDYDPCAELAESWPVVGPPHSLAPPGHSLQPQLTPDMAVATSGTAHLAVWLARRTLFGSFLDDEGRPLDAPARVLATAEFVNHATVGWDGARFVIVWADATHLSWLQLSPEGEPGATGRVELAHVQHLAIEAHDGFTLVVGAVRPTAEDPAGLFGLLIEADGTPRDEGPRALLPTATTQAFAPVAAWDGAAFVVLWRQDDALRAGRVSTSGEPLEPFGVALEAAGAPVAGAPHALVADPAGLIAAWMTRDELDGTSLLVARLPRPLAALQVAPALLATNRNPEFESLLEPALSRSSDGAIALGWLHEDDTGTTTANLLALDASLAPIGPGVELAPRLDGILGLVGLAGTAHLAVQAGDARRLFVTPQGLDVGEGFSTFLGTPNQQAPAVAASPNGYLVAWFEEAPGGDQLVRAARLSTNGTPYEGEPIELGAADVLVPVGVAAQRDEWLVAWRRSGPSLALTRISGEGALLGTTELAAGPGASHVALACLPATCLVAWAEDVHGVDTLFARRVGEAGALLDAAPVEVSRSFARSGGISLTATSEAFLLVWGGGAARVEPTGAVTDLPGFALEQHVSGLPLGASAERLLAVRERAAPNAPIEITAELLTLEGDVVGSLPYEPGALRHAAAAAWEGGAFLFVGHEARALLFDPARPADEPVALAIEPGDWNAVAAMGPGRSLRVAVDGDRTQGEVRLFAQSFERPGAAMCPAFER